jgi:hypothetical protein
MTFPSLFAGAAKRALLALAACAWLGAAVGALAEERWVPQDMRACTPAGAAAGADAPCKQALSADEIARELGKLKTRDLAYAIDGDSLTVTIRMLPAELPYPNGPHLCCELQGYLDKIGDNVYSARFRWSRIAAANLDLQLFDASNKRRARIEHRGSPQFVFAGDKVDAGLIARAGAELTTASLDVGPELGGQRRVSVFKGAACRPKLAGCAVIYMPDGHATAIFANNALANGLDMRRVVIVGVHNAEVDSNGTRIEELLLGYNAARYDAFMRFITHDLAKKVEGDETPRLRLAAGYSNGGAWAYDALNSGGGRFGGAIVMSPGQWKTRRLPG